MARYEGKYAAPSPKRRIPIASVGMILLAVVSLMFGGVVAYLSASTGAATNTFKADTSPNPLVVETFGNNRKSDVKVDVGQPGYAVYVRAAVVVTWKNGDNVLGIRPKLGADYTMTLGNGWFQGKDGFYYYKSAVAYDGSDDQTRLTDSLIVSCAPVEGKTPEGYGLNVEIIAQTIQALGTTDDTDTPAITDAWEISLNDDGTLSPD